MTKPLSLSSLPLVAGALAVAVSASGQAQFTTPQVSPAAMVEQTIGLTEVEVSYHRPAVNERKIWGGLVPFDKVWRAGANDNTTIRFTDAVRIDGQDVAAGTYGLHMIPGSATWTVILSAPDSSLRSVPGPTPPNR